MTAQFGPQLVPVADVSAIAAAAAAAAVKCPSLLPLMQALNDGQSSVGVQFLTDSTGDAVTEWPYLIGQWLAARYSAFNVKYRIWDDTSQDYLATQVIQAAAGGDTYASFPAKSLSIPAAQVTHIGGDLDLRADLSMTDWTPAGNATIAARFTTAGNRAWRWYIGPTGAMLFEWSTDGTTQINKQSTNPGFVDGTRQHVRVVLDVDNGAAGNDVKFYTSTDGATWVQLGSTITTGGTTSIFNAAAAPWELGARGTNGELNTYAKVYEIEIRNGINGPTVNPRTPDAWLRADETSTTIGGSPTLWVIAGAKSGAGITYLNDVTRGPILTPDYSTALVFLSSNHNEGYTVGAALTSAWSGWLAAVRARFPQAALLVITENPRIAPAVNIREQYMRHTQLLEIARTNGLDAIDTFRAFVVDSRGLAFLLNPDGIHPTNTPGANQGSQLWANTITAAMSAASA